MELIGEGLNTAFRLLLQGDREMLRVTLLTLKVSGSATLVSVLLGVPLGLFLALSGFRGRRAAVSLVNTGMGLPPTVVGLFVSILLWRYGPLGFLHLMYTPAAMVIAQSVIAMPLVTGFTMAGIQQLDPRLSLQLLALGASRRQLWWLLVREARLAILAAVIAGFGGVVSEVGASIMVGGNVMGQTRVLTTAIVMEVAKGQFGMAIALSIILLALAYAIILVLTHLQQQRR
ncbi:MAG: ABC transporter permease [Syntrophomonadaceae bacterium]|nr:ABC transporter permease [Syntrophomonadaceae bacterium]